MRILIKLGGTLLDSPESRHSLAVQIAAAAAQPGAEIVVVHGGGKQMTRYLAERGIESRFVNGLRVTSPDVIDAVLKVFAGTLNHELIASLNRAGALAVGLSGIDALLAEAEQMHPDLGAVGRVTKSNAELLRLLAANRYVPVVACVAGDREGRIYNVNADQMAIACASSFRADQLMFLTDVPGVMNAEKEVLPVLTAHEGIELIASGAATGGMQAKLESAAAALRAGVGEVRIAPGTAPNVIGRLLEGEQLGTRMILTAAPAATEVAQ